MIHIRTGTFVAVDLDANNAHMFDHPTSFGWGVCKQGSGLQDFGPMTMVEAIARATELNRAVRIRDPDDGRNPHV